MFKRFKKETTPAMTVPVPASESGKTAHRVTLHDVNAVAYVFTRATTLQGATFHASNVAFVDPDCRPGTECHDVDMTTMDERNGDFDYHAAQHCAAMPADADSKVVVFKEPDCAFAVVDELCRRFGAKSDPTSVKPAPQVVERERQAGDGTAAQPQMQCGHGASAYSMCG
jgi:hypothetical protein